MRPPPPAQDRPGLLGADEPRAALADGFALLEGEPCAVVREFDQLAPFLVNLPTDTDLWMFVSSAGGLTAGRRDPDGALFPYETVDRLHDAHLHSGPVTLLRVRRRGARAETWAPFAPRDALEARFERALYKSVTGCQLTFVERDLETGLELRCRWAGSDATGWVRTATLENHGEHALALEVLDGLRNLLPSGAPLTLYQHSSCLVDAYKRVEVDPETGIGIVSLSAGISDRPEPVEVLRATTVWCCGLPRARLSVSATALASFRRGEMPAVEPLSTGRRAHFIATAALALAPGARVRWHLATDTCRSHAEVEALRARLLRGGDLDAWIEGELRRANGNLRRIIASADGLQLTGREDACAHHFANVLFNCLRGGVFALDHRLPGPDFAAFVRTRDHALAERCAALLAALPATIEIGELHALTAASHDPALRRLGLEYLPLYFGRRHGDPSRPWNRFTIDVRHADGSRALRFEGNWRDVFQNWEALTRSFPGFLPGTIARFVDAGTVDGFNPYRLTRDGFEWEVFDPASPWSGIGYWGDHQIEYLRRLLEPMRRFHPGALEELLAQPCFSYADVPYRLVPYASILADPRQTIRYDHDRARRIAEREAVTGRDARLLHDERGGIVHVTLLEKLIVPVLAKLSNFVPEGGIWMNTERPEWNDANNALVGTGLSVVTLCHLRRHLRLLAELVGAMPAGNVPVSSEVVAWLRAVAGVLETERGALARERIDDRARRRVMDTLGEAFERYREPVYARAFSGREPLAGDEVRRLCEVACAWLEHSFRSNRRDDGLWHAYNLLELGSDGTAAVRRLPLMLEGQVAALSSGLVDAAEAAEVVDRLFGSALYRADVRSFMLYPERELPPFLERNVVPESRALALPLLLALLEAGEASILERDTFGRLRFQADFGRTADVRAALDRLARDPHWASAVARDGDAVCELFEDVFAHRTYTGRSGTMYAYEGIGCVYWHMVGKLLLAIQELALEAFDRGAPPETCRRLARGYFRVRSGLGFEKSAREFGAFPGDPYSHTPAHAGAQQPGMTGQVKEEILTRIGELGIRVEGGRVSFRPVLLRRDEFLAAPATLACYEPDGSPRIVAVPAGGLAFTLAQVPVTYALGRGAARARVLWRDGRTEVAEDARLGDEASRALLGRDGRLDSIAVELPESFLFAD